MQGAILNADNNNNDINDDNNDNTIIYWPTAWYTVVHRLGYRRQNVCLQPARSQPLDFHIDTAVGEIFSTAVLNNETLHSFV